MQLFMKQGWAADCRFCLSTAMLRIEKWLMSISSQQRKLCSHWILASAAASDNREWNWSKYETYSRKCVINANVNSTAQLCAVIGESNQARQRILLGRRDLQANNNGDRKQTVQKSNKICIIRFYARAIRLQPMKRDKRIRFQVSIWPAAKHISYTTLELRMM